MGIPQHDFISIDRPASGSYRDRGSRFLSFAYPVSSVVEVEDHLQQLRQKYHDASHICYAYRLNGDPEQFKSFDAGEPKHAAGDPILNQIRSSGIQDLLVVVVRYFGGTKLGKSGLVNAYKSAAIDALRKTQMIIKTRSAELTICFEIEKTGDLMRILHDHSAFILDYKFMGPERIRISIREERLKQFEASLRNINGRKIS
jgi:uncharacterized YigZ family protein